MGNLASAALVILMLVAVAACGGGNFDQSVQSVEVTLNNAQSELIKCQLHREDGLDAPDYHQQYEAFKDAESITTHNLGNAGKWNDSIQDALAELELPYAERSYVKRGIPPYPVDDWREQRDDYLKEAQEAAGDAVKAANNACP